MRILKYKCVCTYSCLHLCMHILEYKCVCILDYIWVGICTGFYRCICTIPVCARLHWHWEFRHFTCRNRRCRFWPKREEHIPVLLPHPAHPCFFGRLTRLTTMCQAHQVDYRLTTVSHVFSVPHVYYLSNRNVCPQFLQGVPYSYSPKLD